MFMFFTFCTVQFISHIQKRKMEAFQMLCLKMDPCNVTNSRMYFDASFAVRLPKKTDRKTKQ